MVRWRLRYRKHQQILRNNTWSFFVFSFQSEWSKSKWIGKELERMNGRWSFCRNGKITNTKAAKVLLPIPFYSSFHLSSKISILFLIHPNDRFSSFLTLFVRRRRLVDKGDCGTRTCNSVASSAGPTVSLSASRLKKTQKLMMLDKGQEPDNLLDVGGWMGKDTPMAVLIETEVFLHKAASCLQQNSNQTIFFQCLKMV